MSAYWLAALAALAALLLVGCGRDGGAAPGVGCPAVGARLVALGQDRLAALEPEHQSVMRAQLQLVQDQLVATCRERAWPAEVRACFVAAEDTASFDACAGRLKAPAAARSE